MLKKFFLNLLSSFMGTWIALVLFCIVTVLVCVGIVAKLGVSSMKEPQVSKGSIMTLLLSGPITESETPTDIDYFSLLQGDVTKPKTLSSLKAAIEAAKENRNLEAIYIKCEGASASPATFHALRESLIEFKESGKKVVAYGNNFTMGDYYVATVADSLFLNPGGKIILQGLGGISLYYKGLLDKVGVEMQVVKVGTYKSAVEPYILPEMSHPARAQLDTLYGNMWNIICKDISERRKGVTPEKINDLVNDFIFIKEADDDLKSGLVDKLVYERSMDSIMAAMLNKDVKKLNFVSPGALADQDIFNSGYNAGKQVAVLYATGEILDGGGSSTINYEKIVPIITELANNDKIKGMVLRVNSPGGSVFGSEQIGEALDYFQSKGKPLAVSMGDYAASGGYWISCCANRIFADPLTITGSIGIFGLIPNASALIKKIGLSPQLVSTNPEAKFPNLYQPLNERQLAAMQEMVERGYDKFVARVARGRNLTEGRVREIGEGRVWDAIKAKEIGLVDELGNLQDAIEWVASKCEIDDYGISYYPTVETSVWDFLPEIGGSSQARLLSELSGENLSERMIGILSLLLGRQYIQARMPEIKVEFLRSELN